jgi:cutinase
MKFFAASLLATLAVATPIVVPSNDLTARQLGVMTSNDVKSGSSSSCPKAIFIFARASGEQGNMGGSTGPIVASALKRKYGQVWIQGVGSPYSAGMIENTLPDGTTKGAIDEAAKMFNQAHEKCPDVPIVSGGYSQGTAVIAGAIPKLDDKVREQVKGVVLFGYTKNQQNKKGIPSLPSDRLKVFCNPGDMVCVGTLVLTAAHFTYQADAAGAAPKFLEEKIGA